ncbi:MAG: hypothetical protein Q8O04_00070 [Deltaproteobacteria bacterium]|nr:hypothetical protein [Deltaproteobacteria bacterium]
MEENNYKYDVAFSFLAQDEDLATQINDLLQDRLQTFLYSRRQGELAGTDGEKTFNRVFSSEARIVFVLYRKEWGSTPWTRIEETAIRNRAFEEGYDFVIFAPLEKPPSVPQYLPKNRLWVGLERWGIEGAASVIESRVQEAGGTPSEESVEDYAKRLAKKIKAEEDIKRFLHSDKGVKRANQELSKLFSELKQTADTISADDSAIKLHCEHNQNRCVIFSEGFTLFLHWSQSFSNTLESSGLYVSLYEGRMPLDGSFFPPRKPRLLQEIEFNFWLTTTEQVLWESLSRGKASYSSEKLGKFVLSLLLDQVEKKKKGEREF